MIVVADTSPINYLLLIGQVDLLSRLFQQVIIPDVVRDEILDPFAHSFFGNGLPMTIVGYLTLPYFTMMPLSLL